MLQHKVKISVKKPGYKERAAIRAAEKKIHRRLLRWLLGDEMNILVISPSPSVRTVEIQEVIADTGIK
jgi:hypothetical protein